MASPDVTKVLETMRDIYVKARKTGEDLTRAATFSTGTGLNNYDLKPIADITQPEFTPIRNTTPRLMGNRGDTASHWKNLRSINTGNFGSSVEEGKRNEPMAVDLVDMVAPFASFSMESSVTDEAEWGSEGFDSALGKAAYANLNGMMREEESFMVGGNRTLALGQPNAPTLADISADGGTIAQTTTVKVYCVPLTMRGVRRASVANGVIISQTVTPIIGTPYTRKGFSGKISSVASITTATDANNAHVVTATVPVVAGVFGYAWFWGPTEGADSVLGAITTINSVRITTAAGTGTQASNATGITTDNSTDALGLDGYVYLAVGAGQVTPAESTSGAVISSFATGTPGIGTGFTTDSAGGVTEINAMLQTMWETNQVGPDEIWLSTRDKEAARRLVIKNGGAPLVRFVQDASGGKGAIVSGASELVNYVNPFTGDSINLRAHADLPNGVMFGRRLRPIPYRNSGIDNPVEMYMQREYFQENFPRTQFQWEVAVKARGVLRGRAMFTVCVAHNIGTTTI